MFPLVHYFVNRAVYNTDDQLMILGGLWPDLAVRAGISRNQAHEMGEDFYRWCLHKAPQSMPLAYGILGHGLNPKAVDYYADEDWPGGQKGWCFQLGKNYEQDVARVTGLSAEYSWWKSHNFVELCCEMLTMEKAPLLGKNILEASLDPIAKGEAARLLSAFSGCTPAAVEYAFGRVSKIFALLDLSPPNLAEKQASSIALRLPPEQYNCDVPAMASLLEKMREELRPHYTPFMEKLLELCLPLSRLYP